MKNVVRSDYGQMYEGGLAAGSAQTTVVDNNQGATYS